VSTCVTAKRQRTAGMQQRRTRQRVSNRRSGPMAAPRLTLLSVIRAGPGAHAPTRRSAWPVALSPLAVEVCRSGQSGAGGCPRLGVRVQAWSFLFHSWWVRPLGEVTDSTVKRSSRPLDPSQRDTPRPRVIGTITRCMNYRWTLTSCCGGPTPASAPHATRHGVPE